MWIMSGATAVLPQGSQPESFLSTFCFLWKKRKQKVGIVSSWKCNFCACTQLKPYFCFDNHNWWRGWGAAADPSVLSAFWPLKMIMIGLINRHKDNWVLWYNLGFQWVQLPDLAQLFFYWQPQPCVKARRAPSMRRLLGLTAWHSGSELSLQMLSKTWMLFSGSSLLPLPHGPAHPPVPVPAPNVNTGDF